MPEFIRVRFKDSGTEQSIAKPTTTDDDAYDVLDEPAVDHNGRLVPPKLRDRSTETDAPSAYDDMTVADLKAEIARRNDGRDDGRDDDTQIPASGNKPDLIQALTADDNKES